MARTLTPATWNKQFAKRLREQLGPNYPIPKQDWEDAEYYRRCERLSPKDAGNKLAAARRQPEQIMPRTPKAYGYCRLSKDEITVRCSACQQEWTLRIKNKEQTEFDCPFCNRTYQVEKRDPLSIQSQSDICRRIVEQKLPPEIARGLEIVADINVSGKMPVRKRPNGGELMQRLRPGDYLILPLLDRGFRNLADWCNQAEFFRRHKINLIIGDFPDIDINDPMGEMWLNLMAMFAQWYRQQVSRHTKRGLAKLKALGLPNSGKVPRGFALKCTACERIYSHAESAKGQACPGCKIPRKKNSIYVPHEGEQKLMWKLLWHRSAFCWKTWITLEIGVQLGPTSGAGSARKMDPP